MMLMLSILAYAGPIGCGMYCKRRKETAVQKGKTALRVDVANAVRRLWKVGADGRIPAWAPGTTGPLGTCLSEDVELRQLMEGVAEAGSWVGGVDGRFLEKLDEAACCWRGHLQTSAHSYR
jgi:hypothetical protein